MTVIEEMVASALAEDAAQPTDQEADHFDKEGFWNFFPEHSQDEIADAWREYQNRIATK